MRTSSSPSCLSWTWSSSLWPPERHQQDKSVFEMPIWLDFTHLLHVSLISLYACLWVIDTPWRRGFHKVGFAGIERSSMFTLMNVQSLFIFFWIGEGGISVMGLTGIEHIPPGDPPLPLKIPASPSHQNSSLPCPRRFPPSTDAAALSDRGTKFWLCFSPGKNSQGQLSRSWLLLTSVLAFAWVCILSIHNITWLMSLTLTWPFNCFYCSHTYEGL